MRNCAQVRWTLIAASLVAAQVTWAAAAPDEAKSLGAQLTRFGAEAAGNADGSIPAYTGGLKNAPKHTGDYYPDPFEGEKPQHSITQQNMGQYESLLGEGTKALLKRYSTYRVDVYPTHRTMTYPDWFIENTIKNATTAKLGGKIEGDKLTGAAPDGYPYQGIPFPIPKNGYEVMWNHALRFAPPITLQRTTGWLVDASGKRNELPSYEATYVHPWSESSGKLRKTTYDAYYGLSTVLVTPPTSAGIYFLNYYTADAAADQPVWFYTPGQRRVRKAPEFAYDIPMSAYAGVLVWDEYLGFQGRMDRFDFKLIGKKEMIVPYNTFGVSSSKSIDQILDKNHLNPGAVRWEKRRVWVVEAIRKADARHAYSKREFYIEEDCWCLVAADVYDSAGKLWRAQQLFNFPTHDVGGMNNDAYVVHDFQKGNFVTSSLGRADKGSYVRSYGSADALKLVLTPQAIESGSVR